MFASHVVRPLLGWLRRDGGRRQAAMRLGWALGWLGSGSACVRGSSDPAAVSMPTAQPGRAQASNAGTGSSEVEASPLDQATAGVHDRSTHDDANELGDTPIVVDEHATPMTATPIEFVEEMRGEGRSWSLVAPSLTTEEMAAFEQAWREHVPRLERRIVTDDVRRLSRWAKPQMEAFALPANWLASMPMPVIGATSDQRIVRFGPKTAGGLVLPSHSPLVFRYLVVFSDFDRRTRTITRVVVTIRGWVEE